MTYLKIIFPLILVGTTTVHSEQPDAEEIEKTLFFPTREYSTLIPLHSTLNFNGIQNADVYNYRTLMYNEGTRKYPNILQQEFPNQNAIRNILYVDGRNKKLSAKHDINEDNYRIEANSIGMVPENKLLLEDLSSRITRSLTYPSWSLPPKLSTNNNYVTEVFDDYASTGSRAVSVQMPFIRPFGPYTTWSPYEGPKIISHTGQVTSVSTNTNSGQQQMRKKRDTTIQSVGGNTKQKLLMPTGRSPDWPQISFPHPVFPTAPVVHGMHHIISPHGAVLPTPIKEGALHMIVHNPGYAIVYNMGFL